MVRFQAYVFCISSFISCILNEMEQTTQFLAALLTQVEIIIFFVRALRRSAEYMKVFWFFKSCRSRRDLSNALVESVFDCKFFEIRPFY